jgi:hypothetical protein
MGVCCGWIGDTRRLAAQKRGEMDFTYIVAGFISVVVGAAGGSLLARGGCIDGS